MESSIIHLVNQELVDALTPDVFALKELMAQIKQCSDNLAALSTKMGECRGQDRFADQRSFDVAGGRSYLESTEVAKSGRRM